MNDMTHCVKCGRDYEPTGLWIGPGEKPSGRMVVEVGREKVSQTIALCPVCTERVLKWIAEKEEEEKECGT